MLNPFQHSLLSIRFASLLVPSLYRESWRNEWEAEIWHAWHSMRDRGESSAFIRSQLREFCKGSFTDAAWYRWNMFDREELVRVIRNGTRSPGFCLGTIAAVIVMLGVLSGFFPTTRDILLPLPYANADRVATLSQSGFSLSARSGVPNQWVRWWRTKSKLLDGAATYRWRDDLVADAAGHAAHVTAARVSEEFFPLLGVRTSSGRTFRRGDSVACQDCVLLSYDFWSRNFSSRPVSAVTLGGRHYRVLGVLDKRFWFLSRHIAVWSLAGPSELGLETRTGVVVRLGPDVTKKAAQAELGTILVEEAGFSPWDSLVDISMIHERVHSVFGSFALGLVLALVMAVAGLRLRLPSFGRQGCARALFFNCKTGMALLAVLLAGLEFTRAPSITMIGGTDLATEPLSTWLFLIASMGVLSWSIYDQRRRCRVCLRRLGMAAHVGCPGCLLLNWAGTELVCIEGHGMLHVPEMTSSWQDAEQWTTLDESWMELFER
jgi:MacB-like periplasmic core domain